MVRFTQTVRTCFRPDSDKGQQETKTVHGGLVYNTICSMLAPLQAPAHRLVGLVIVTSYESLLGAIST